MGDNTCLAMMHAVNDCPVVAETVSQVVVLTVVRDSQYLLMSLSVAFTVLPRQRAHPPTAGCGSRELARCVVDKALQGSLDASAMLKRVRHDREVAVLRRDFRALCCRCENIVSVMEDFRGLVERTQRLGGIIDGVRGLGRLP